MDSIVKALTDPTYIAFAIGINFLVRYLKPLVRLVIRIKSRVLHFFGVEWTASNKYGYRLLVFLMASIPVVYYESNWVNLKLIGDSMFASIFYLWFLSWMVYDVGVKVVFKAIKKKWLTKMGIDEGEDTVDSLVHKLTDTQKAKTLKKDELA